MLLAYLAVSCVLFLVARYSSLPFPSLSSHRHLVPRLGTAWVKGWIGGGVDGLEDLGAK